MREINIASQKFFIHEALICLLAFSLPLHSRIPPVIIALLLINWLFTNDWKNYLEFVRNRKMILLPVVLYLMYCFGVFFSENQNAAWFDLQVKLSLLILPMIFVSQNITASFLKKIMNFFVAGCVLASLVCIGHSIFLYYDEIRQVKEGLLRDTYTNFDFFFAGYLSCFFHPSYLAMYLCFAVGYGLMTITSKSNKIKPINIFLLIFILFYLSVFVFFLASRMGIIVLAITWLFFGVQLIVKRKMYLMGAIFLAIIISSTFILYHSSKIIASRFDYAIHSIFSKNVDKTSSESSAVRMLIWFASAEVIAEHPFGVGTGDVVDVLAKKYAEKGMTYVYERRFNAHSQFFQTAIGLGIMPGLFIISVLLLPLRISFKNKDFLLSFFILNCILNFSVESMLEVQAGVLFFSFFYSIFLNKELRV